MSPIEQLVRKSDIWLICDKNLSQLIVFIGLSAFAKFSNIHMKYFLSIQLNLVEKNMSLGYQIIKFLIQCLNKILFDPFM